MEGSVRVPPMKMRARYRPEPVLPLLRWRAAALALAAVLGMGAPGVFAQATQESAPAPEQQQQTPQQPAPQGEAAPDEGTITERNFEDWTVRCGRQGDQGAQVCEMQQQQADNQDRVIMAVAVGKVPGTSDLGLLVMLPLGILLPVGATLQIDGGAEVPLEVDRCERQGCRIEMLLEPDLLNQLKGGSEAKVFFEAVNPQGERQRLGVPISLLGFTAALNEVTS
jgi:invasion protein IalB